MAAAVARLMVERGGDLEESEHAVGWEFAGVVERYAVQGGGFDAVFFQ